MPPDLRSIVDVLEKTYGRPKPTRLKGVLNSILWENVVYLADDEKRRVAYDSLRREVGLSPQEILSAPEEKLLGVTRLAGILPGLQLKKLRRVAQIAQDDFGGNVEKVLQLPLVRAKRSLMKFPGIGEPGAEKILLFSGSHAVFALESNGLRVLLRIGFGREQSSYARSYRSVREAVKDQVLQDCAWLIKAHRLLREHGQKICRRTSPACAVCTLREGCRHGQMSGTTSTRD